MFAASTQSSKMRSSAPNQGSEPTSDAVWVTASPTASHTDSSTEQLLVNLLQGGLSVGDAVTQTASEVGPDPWFGAELRILEG